MFEMFDCVHFNSSVSRDVYNSHLNISKGEIVPITHADIKDCRKARTYNDDILKLVFIGSTNTYKGFPRLECVLNHLSKEGLLNYELNVWGGAGSSDNPRIKFKGNFKSSELNTVFQSDSLLVIPSVWNETFGFTALEAISFGTPALVSSTVGAKDVVSEYDSWFVFDSEESLKNKLKELLIDRSKLVKFNEAIISNKWKHSIEEHSKEIIKLYK